MQTPLNFVRVHNRQLSLWQSSVSDFARQDLSPSGKSLTQNMVLQHPLVQATSDHVKSTAAGIQPDPSNLDVFDVHQRNIYLSHLAFQRAVCLIEGDNKRAEELLTTYRQYSDKDPGFLTCITTYLYYYKQCNGVLKYNDWTVEGNNNINYGVISYTLSNDAIVAVIGDWGTGLADAQALLQNIIQTHKPDAIIHLGDIYYSGTPAECMSNFSSIIQSVFTALSVSIPVFSIPGNHDYYAFGSGYYQMVTGLNTGDAVQEASYFCLRTEDNGWQFLGMDTGYFDSDPADQVNPFYAAPQLNATEVTWHQDKLKNFAGATILLSHNQAFSANQALNGQDSSYWSLPFLNPYLYTAFLPFFQTKIAGWLWGHEHNFMMFENNLFGLSKGRLLGCSAYEELGSSNPYQSIYPEVRFYPVELSADSIDNNGVAYYNHAYGIIDFSQRQFPSDSVNVNYYQFPSWGDNPPPLSKQIATPLLQQSEQFTMPSATQASQVMYANQANLVFDEVLFISSLYNNHIEYYPTLATDLPVNFQLISVNENQGMSHGDSIHIVTTEAAAGDYNMLGAWSTPTAYYYKSGYNQELWTVLKIDRSNGDEIHYGDLVLFYNQSYQQYLVPYWSKVYGALYLSTSDDNTNYWSILQPLSDQANLREVKKNKYAQIALANASSILASLCKANKRYPTFL